MLWARPGASRSSGRRQGRRYRDRVDSQGRCRCTFIAPTILADSGHVACSTMYEAWIRLRDLVNLYLAGGRVPGPWPSRLRPPGYGPKTERLGPPVRASAPDRACRPQRPAGNERRAPGGQPVRRRHIRRRGCANPRGPPPRGQRRSPSTTANQLYARNVPSRRPRTRLPGRRSSVLVVLDAAVRACRRLAVAA